jgi:hypothetical protein
MLSVTYEFFMLSVVMLNVIMLSVFMLSVVATQNTLAYLTKYLITTVKVFTVIKVPASG